MTERQQLGGLRRGEPLADEECYPLTMDEYLTIKEKLSLEKFTNIESVLFSTCLAALISGIIFWKTGTFYYTEIVDGIPKEIIDKANVIILSIYGGVLLGTLIGLIIYQFIKKKTKTTIERLDKKILKHLQKPE